ncbi:hypothetical protein TNCV_4349731 [Trichonephila clavipes]|nr:hypothetical protein TNCV_4349731 [Trichonephila clavipes]
MNSCRTLNESSPITTELISYACKTTFSILPGQLYSGMIIQLGYVQNLQNIAFSQSDDIRLFFSVLTEGTWSKTRRVRCQVLSSSACLSRACLRCYYEANDMQIEPPSHVRQVDVDSSGVANSDEQKAILLVLTLKNNFTPDNKIYPSDVNITNILEDFLSHPPPLFIAPTNPDEMPDYAERFPNNKAPGSDIIPIK